MRILRRGVIAQRKSGYVWAVYTLVPGVDESVFTTGSFNMTASFSSTPSLMAADGYTVSASGTISLTSAVKTNVSALTAGKYIVSISSSSSTTTTSTQYVYKVTGVTSSGSTFRKTYTVSYERYEISLAMKGADTGERVKGASDTEYPINGVQDGYYYVLIEANGDPCVWAVYNAIYGIDESTRIDNSSENPSNDDVINYGTGYTVNQSKQEITLTGVSTSAPATLPVGVYVCGYGRILAGKYQVASKFEDTTNNAVGKVTEVDDDYFSGSKPVRIKVDWYKLEKNSKGEDTGTYVSGNAGDYPDAGAQGDYYYERLTPQ